MVEVVSGIGLGVGLWFWFWGTPVLLTRHSILFKLHHLSVADTLGSMAIMAGLLVRRPREWPLLVLAVLSLVMWNTVLGYVLAYCASAHQPVSVETPDGPNH
ncbi:MAG: monovalent cation/H(+) antiporter subunit G [Gloeomargarita sp. SKYBB_i_bin120]|nr:monovalent cation/H(+) antiporter subunit G [Gloeomargarita sp. SKYB120]MDW8177692.1 monovalent cation/H(+) antiporter subunit G [Gloeomargarita sp. SKYBB_i_bin120]